MKSMNSQMLQIRYFPKITSDFWEFNRLPPLDKELSALRVLNHDWVDIRKMSIEFSIVSLFTQWQRHKHRHRQHSGMPTERRQYAHTNTHTHTNLCASYRVQSASEVVRLCASERRAGVSAFQAKQTKPLNTHEHNSVAHTGAARWRPCAFSRW